MIQKRRKQKKKKKKTKVQELHTLHPLFSSRVKYFPHLAKVNLRVWSLFRHDTSILAFHLGFIFK